MERPIQFGPYLLLDKLGEGAQGDVHLARHVRQHEPLVIKRIHPQRLTSAAFVSRFKHEALIATSVESRHVIKVVDVGRVDDRLYIAMEYVPGWPLSSVIKDLKQTGEQASIASVADVVVGALEGLHALHTARAPDGDQLGIVHRDIAPKNLMLSDEGVLKVIDLGLGKSTRQDWATATGIVMGTPGYMSPEQATAETVDHRADLFAMGVVLFELLTLDRYMPMKSISELLAVTLRSQYRRPSSLRPEVPGGIDEVVRRAVEIDPARRFQSAREFADAIRDVVPSRTEDSAKSLLTALAWNDVTKTRAEVRALVARRMDEIDETAISKRIVFSARPMVNADVDANAPTVTGSGVGPRPMPPGRSWGRFITPIAALLLVGAGWFGRGWLEKPTPAPTLIPAPPPPAPLSAEAPAPIVTARPEAPPDPVPPPPPPRKAPSRKREVRPPPPPVAPPPPTAPPPPARLDLRTHVNRLTKEAQALQGREAPADQKKLITVISALSRLATLPMLDGQEKTIAEMEEEIRSISSRSRAE